MIELLQAGQRFFLVLALAPMLAFVSLPVVQSILGKLLEGAAWLAGKAWALAQWLWWYLQFVGVMLAWVATLMWLLERYPTVQAQLAVWALDVGAWAVSTWAWALERVLEAYGWLSVPQHENTLL